jgi:hypothetical protein
MRISMGRQKDRAATGVTISRFIPEAACGAGKSRAGRLREVPDDAIGLPGRFPLETSVSLLEEPREYYQEPSFGRSCRQ